MKTRILSGLACITLLIIVMILGEVALGVTLVVFSIIGLNEFYKAMEKIGVNCFKKIGYVWSFAILLSVPMISNFLIKLFNINQSKYEMCIFLMAFLSVILQLTIMVFKNEKHNIKDVALTTFGIIYVVFLLIFLVKTRSMENGNYLVWFIFIGAYMTDTAAYFVGVFFGKTKIIPSVSPKKTYEGSIGGMIGCTIITLLYGLYLNKYVSMNLSIVMLVLIGIINGVISQIGDWSASAIKRYVNIKDYGDLIPGHGGVLDRFDSMLFIAPTVYFFLNIFN